MSTALKFAIAHWSVAEEASSLTPLGSLSLSFVVLKVF